MKNTFNLPSTRTCKVVFVRGGVKYASTIPTPRNNEGLQMVMLSKNIGISQIQAIEPVVELAPLSQPLNRPHPAQHKIVQYSSFH